MYITEKGKNYIAGTLKWAKFFYVIIVIAIAAMALFSLGMLAAAFIGGPGEETVMVVIMALLYLLVAGFYVLPALYLKRCMKASLSAICNDSDADMEESLKNMNLLVKFTGILSIAGFIISIIAVIVGLFLSVIA